MQQRDCGCGSNRTPTLDELLAWGRPLPTIRHRRPARVAANMRGWVKWGLIDRSGRETRGGEGPNLITDQGLDQIATQTLVHELAGGALPAAGSYFPIIAYCAVGTDNTAPATTDTALGTEVARTNTTYQTEELNRTANGVYELTRYMEFDYDEANGNLTEWGFSYDATGPGLLFNRALFLDGGGSPEVVTKSSDYKLRIIYTLEVTLSPVTLTAGAFTVTGVGTVNGDYTLVGDGSPPGIVDANGMRCAAADLKVFSRLARGDHFAKAVNLSNRHRDAGILVALDSDQSAVAYTSATGPTSGAWNNFIADEIVARDAYVGGSFERTGGSWKFGTSVGNQTPITAFGVSIGESYNSGLSHCEQYGYVFDLDLADEFTKDNEHTLTIGCPTVTWGRS